MGIYKMRTNFGHQMRWLMGVLAVIFIIGGAFMFGAGPGARNAGGNRGQSNNDVVATVNDMPITRGEMDAAWNQTWEMLRDRGMRSSLQMAQARARVFQSLIDSRMILLLAKSLGVEVSNRDVANKRDEMIVEYLKQNRRSVLGGKLSAEREKLDPRDDAEYKTELARSVGPNGGPMTIGQIENTARTIIPEGQIQYQLAQEGLEKAIRKQTSDVSEQDVKDSYNVYSVRQIMILKSILPEEQLKARVDRIVSQAKGGGDFAALAKQYTIDPSKGAVQSMSYEMVSPEVWDQISKLKPGEISNPIDTDMVVYIIKVEGVTPKLPAKFDKKAQSDRRDMIQSMRERQMRMKYDADARRKIVVVVTDPELEGYWRVSKIQQAKSEADAKKQLILAGNAFKKAVIKEPNNQYADAMLSMVLQQQGNTKQAVIQLYHLLEGEDARGEGWDLRVVLADMLMKSGKKADAMKQYNKASDVAGADPEAHKQLVTKFKQVGLSDLAAKEQKWVTQYETNKKLYEAQQKQSGKSAPAPAGP